jgi:arginine:ornithine antiporter / lysine permease
MTATSVEVGTSTRSGLGLLPLTALVVGSMIGGGVFSLPQNMAAGAGAGAVLIGWAITGVGMLTLAFVYQELAIRKPALNAGPYSYARAGFGDFIGFCSAWGYWLSAWIGNVSYAVLIFGALGYFYPVFGEGNSWQAILGASLVLWLVHGLILYGIRGAALVNAVTTLAKLIPIVIFIVVVAIGFDVSKFRGDFWGSPSLGTVFSQVTNTMLVTLWVFIGVEGASVFSARARDKRDVGRATLLGFLAALVVYSLVSVLSMGVLAQPELADLTNPSMAGVLEQVAGPWGSALISIGVVVSVGGAFLSWTLLAAEIPFVAAKDGTMPKFLTGENGNGSPSNSLWITNLLVQAFLVLTYYYQSTYQALFYIASTAILVPYIFSGGYALKLALSGEARHLGGSRARDIAIGLIATIYGIWLVYAAGLSYLLMCALLYVPGILLYWRARKEAALPVFKLFEALLAAALGGIAVLAGVLMYQGTISPL